MDAPVSPARATQGDARAEKLGADFSKLSALEIAARRGIGPLSSKSEIVWHGETRPCVSCGQLILRTAERCEHCGQLLSGNMVQRMRQHSGPWYVLEHVRPFPGVSKERMILQIRRGFLTHTTIIRGPSTHHQWRFAAETPGVSKYLGVCWACQADVSESDTECPVCRKNLESDGEEVLIEGDETLEQPKGELDQLKAVVRSMEPRRRTAHPPAKIGRIPAWWIVALIVVLLMATVTVISLERGDGRNRKDTDGTHGNSSVLPDAQGLKPAATSGNNEPPALTD